MFIKSSDLSFDFVNIQLKNSIRLSKPWDHGNLVFSDDVGI